MTGNLPRYLAWALAILFLAAVAWWVAGGSSPGADSNAAEGPAAAEARLDFPPFELAIDALEPIWAEERALPRPSGPETDDVIDAWHRANFVTAMVELDRFDGDHQAVIDDWKAQLRAWMDLRDPAEYKALSWIAWESFERAFQEILRRASVTDTRLEDLLNDPLDPDVHLQFEACGGFLGHALRLGLVGERGELAVRPELVLVLFRAKWFRDIDDLHAMERTMPGPELREYRRWLIEDAGLPFDARLRAIDDFEATFGFRRFPVAFAQAVAHHDAGDLEAAVAALAEADRVAPDNPIVTAGIAALAAP